MNETLDVFGLKLQGWRFFNHADRPMVRCSSEKLENKSIKITFFNRQSKCVEFWDEIDHLNDVKPFLDLSQCLSDEECMEKIDEWLIRMSKLQAFK